MVEVVDSIEHEIGLRLRFDGTSVSGELRVDHDLRPRKFGSWLGLLSLLENLNEGDLEAQR